jgi:hypothetical protein
MKHYLVLVDITNGEYGYIERFLLDAENYDSANNIAKKRLSEGADERGEYDESSTFYYNGGCEARSINNIQEIQDVDYNVLVHYL